MKALILSDIHANIDALRTVAEKESDADMICCAGDLVDYGVYPKEVLSFVREHHIRCVQGNHDRRVVAMARENRYPDLTKPHWFADFNLHCLSDDDLAFLAELPVGLFFEADGVEYYLSHSFRGGYDEIAFPGQFREFWNENCPASDPLKKHRCIFGHTHRSGYLAVSDTELWLNPGSVSYNHGDGSAAAAHYAVIENGLISLRTLDYPRKQMADRIRSLNLNETDAPVGRLFFCGDE